jgi:hypothetical protein
MSKPSQVHGRVAARNFQPVQMTDKDIGHFAALRGVGIQLDNSWIQQVMAENGIVSTMDSNDVGPWAAAQSALTTPSIAAQIQFLQTWLPGFVQFATAARNIDKLIGMQTVGAWEDEEVVQGTLEPIGNAMPYLDHTNVPLASWNVNFERRTVVRFELGLLVGTLEEMRSARMRLATAAEKRKAVQLALEIQRNRIGFYGYNSGNNRTYGLLNDPQLPAYQTVANGAGGSPLWSGKTFLEITKDLRLALSQLRTNSKDVIDPKSTPITLAIATSRVDLLTITSDFGISVLDWLRTNYPNVRIESAPELDDANGGAAVFYMFADKVDDGSTDDSAVIAQIVPAKFMALGVEKRSKSYVEDFANATAGTLVKRPYAVVRFTGI